MAHKSWKRGDFVEGIAGLRYANPIYYCVAITYTSVHPAICQVLAIVPRRDDHTLRHEASSLSDLKKIGCKSV
ncbi:MAG: hypothetical protein ABI363_03880 [Nitrosospira sp.]